MKSLKRLFSSPFTRKSEAASSSQPDSQQQPIRRFSEPNISQETLASIDTTPIVDPNVNKPAEEIGASEPMPNLFERSLKVIFPKQGNSADHETTLRDASSNLTDVVNIGIKDRKAIILFASADSCQEQSSTLQSALGSEFKVKRMKDNTISTPLPGGSTTPLKTSKKDKIQVQSSAISSSDNITLENRKLSFSSADEIMGTGGKKKRRSSKIKNDTPKIDAAISGSNDNSFITATTTIDKIPKSIIASPKPQTTSPKEYPIDNKLPPTSTNIDNINNNNKNDITNKHGTSTTDRNNDEDDMYNEDSKIPISSRSNITELTAVTALLTDSNPERIPRYDVPPVNRDNMPPPTIPSMISDTAISKKASDPYISIKDTNMKDSMKKETLSTNDNISSTKLPDSNHLPVETKSKNRPSSLVIDSDDTPLITQSTIDESVAHINDITSPREPVNMSTWKPLSPTKLSSSKKTGELVNNDRKRASSLTSDTTSPRVPVNMNTWKPLSPTKLSSSKTTSTPLFEDENEDDKLIATDSDIDKPKRQVDVTDISPREPVNMSKWQPLSPARISASTDVNNEDNTIKNDWKDAKRLNPKGALSSGSRRNDDDDDNNEFSFHDDHVNKTNVPLEIPSNVEDSKSVLNSNPSTTVNDQGYDIKARSRSLSGALTPSRNNIQIYNNTPIKLHNDDDDDDDDDDTYLRTRTSKRSQAATINTLGTANDSDNNIKKDQTTNDSTHKDDPGTTGSQPKSSANRLDLSKDKEITKPWTDLNPKYINMNDSYDGTTAYYDTTDNHPSTKYYDDIIDDNTSASKNHTIQKGDQLQSNVILTNTKLSHAVVIDTPINDIMSKTEDQYDDISVINDDNDDDEIDNTVKSTLTKNNSLYHTKTTTSLEINKFTLSDDSYDDDRLGPTYDSRDTTFPSLPETITLVEADNHDKRITTADMNQNNDTIVDTLDEENKPIKMSTSASPWKSATVIRNDPNSKSTLVDNTNIRNKITVDTSPYDDEEEDDDDDDFHLNDKSNSKALNDLKGSSKDLNAPPIKPPKSISPTLSPFQHLNLSPSPTYPPNLTAVDKLSETNLVNNDKDISNNYNTTTDNKIKHVVDTWKSASLTPAKPEKPNRLTTLSRPSSPVLIDKKDQNNSGNTDSEIINNSPKPGKPPRKSSIVDSAIDSSQLNTILVSPIVSNSEVISSDLSGEESHKYSSIPNSNNTITSSNQPLTRTNDIKTIDTIPTSVIENYETEKQENLAMIQLLHKEIEVMKKTNKILQAQSKVRDRERQETEIIYIQKEKLFQVERKEWLIEKQRLEQELQGKSDENAQLEIQVTQYKDEITRLQEQNDIVTQDMDQKVTENKELQDKIIDLSNQISELSVQLKDISNSSTPVVAVVDSEQTYQDDLVLPSPSPPPPLTSNTINDILDDHNNNNNNNHSETAKNVNNVYVNDDIITSKDSIMKEEDDVHVTDSIVPKNTTTPLESIAMTTILSSLQNEMTSLRQSYDTNMSELNTWKIQALQQQEILLNTTRDTMVSIIQENSTKLLPHPSTSTESEALDNNHDIPSDEYTTVDDIKSDQLSHHIENKIYIDSWTMTDIIITREFSIQTISLSVEEEEEKEEEHENNDNLGYSGKIDSNEDNDRNSSLKEKKVSPKVTTITNELWNIEKPIQYHLDPIQNAEINTKNVQSNKLYTQKSSNDNDMAKDSELLRTPVTNVLNKIQSSHPSSSNIKNIDETNKDYYTVSETNIKNIDESNKDYYTVSENTSTYFDDFDELIKEQQQQEEEEEVYNNKDSEDSSTNYLQEYIPENQSTVSSKITPFPSMILHTHDDGQIHEMTKEVQVLLQENYKKHNQSDLHIPVSVGSISSHNNNDNNNSNDVKKKHIPVHQEIDSHTIVHHNAENQNYSHTSPISETLNIHLNTVKADVHVHDERAEESNIKISNSHHSSPISRPIKMNTSHIPINIERGDKNSKMSINNTMEIQPNIDNTFDDAVYKQSQSQQPYILYTSQNIPNTPQQTYIPTTSMYGPPTISDQPSSNAPYISQSAPMYINHNGIIYAYTPMGQSNTSNTYPVQVPITSVPPTPAQYVHPMTARELVQSYQNQNTDTYDYNRENVPVRQQSNIPYTPINNNNTGMYTISNDQNNQSVSWSRQQQQQQPSRHIYEEYTPLGPLPMPPSSSSTQYIHNTITQQIQPQQQQQQQSYPSYTPYTYEYDSRQLSSMPSYSTHTPINRHNNNNNNINNNTTTSHYENTSTASNYPPSHTYIPPLQQLPSSSPSLSLSKLSVPSSVSLSNATKAAILSSKLPIERKKNDIEEIRKKLDLLKKSSLEKENMKLNKSITDTTYLNTSPILLNKKLNMKEELGIPRTNSLNSIFKEKNKHSLNKSSDFGVSSTTNKYSNAMSYYSHLRSSLDQ